ncbi:MAG: RNA ligase, Rnl2 family [Phycisphaerae bacterium]|jgi:Rnl2 family RNA ligase|nr:RNA ligase, Rnl2 family [Phycisphaerae bacterium]
MEKLKHYSSIENSYQDEFIQKIVENGFDAGEFVVQEKVHGANLSFWCNGERIKCAKRTEFIEEDDAFYADSHKVLLSKYERAIFEIFSLAKTIKPDVKVVAVFGELFGGGYPHVDVERDKNAVAIQKGIFYCPSNEFYAFDILLDSTEYLSVDQANALFDKVDMFYAKTLFRGTFDEALKYSNSFESAISGWLGLPPIEYNLCEGVVIRPVESRSFPQGSRVIIKNKNEAWQENTKHNKLVLDQDMISDAADAFAEEITNYVTENRFNNVVSKIGEVGPEDFGKVIGMFSADVLDDFLKDYGSEFELLEKKEKKLIKKSLATSAAKLVRELLGKA